MPWRCLAVDGLKDKQKYKTNKAVVFCLRLQSVERMAQRRERDEDSKKDSWRSRDKKAMKFASNYVESLIAEEQHKKEQEELSLASTSSAGPTEVIESDLLPGEVEVTKLYKHQFLH